MPTLAEVKQQVQQAKAEVQTRQAEAEQARAQVQRTRQQLPDVRSQQALRSKFDGLKGRAQRRQIRDIKESLGEKTQKIKEYETALTTYQTSQIEPIEAQIKSYESNKKVIDAYNASVAKVGVGSVSSEIITQFNLSSQEEQAYRTLVEEQGIGAQNINIQQAERLESIDTLVAKSNLGEGLSGAEQKLLRDFEVQGLVTSKLIAPEISDLQAMSVKVKDRTTKQNDFSIFQMVGATAITEPKDLKGSTTFDRDGTINVLSGLSVGVDTVKPPRDTFIRRIIGGREDFDAGKEVIQKDLGIVTAAPTRTGEGTPVFIRTLTPAEIARMDRGVKGVDVGKAILDVPYFGATIGTSKKVFQDVPFFRTTIGGVPQRTFEVLEDVGTRVTRAQRDLSRTDIITSKMISPELREAQLKGSEILLTKAVPVVGREVTRGGIFFVPVVGAAALGVEGVSLAERSRPERRLVETERVVEEAWKEYQLEPAPEEGFRKLTRQEFILETSPQISSQLKAGVRKEALFLGGALAAGGLLFGASKLTRFLRKPIITTEKLSVKTKAPETLGFIKKPSLQETTKKGTKIVQEVTGSSFLKAPGQRTIVTTKLRQLLGADPLFKGSAQLAPKEFKRTLKFLERRKLVKTESEAKRLLRLRRPKFEETRFTGRAETFIGEGKPQITITGAKVTKPIVREVKGVRTLQKRPRLEKIEAEGTPIEGGKGDVELYKFTQVQTKVSPKPKPGRAETTFDITSGVKPEGEVKLVVRKTPTTLKVFTGDLKVYKEVDIIKQTRPFKRKLTFDRSKVLVQEGKPDVVIDLAEDTLVQQVRTGRRSSQQFLESLTKPTQEGLATGVSKIIKAPRPTPTAKPIVIKPGEGLPLMVGGLGLKRIPVPAGGVGIITETETIITPPKTITTITSPALMEDTKTVQVTTQQPRLEERTLEAFKTTQQFRTQQTFKTQPAIKEGLKEAPKSREILKTFLKFRTQQRVKTGTELITKQTTKPKPRPTTTPVTTVPKTPIKTGGLLSRLAKKVDEGALFEAFFKKKGEEITLGTAKTKLGAEKLLKKKLVESLAAGGGIKFAGKKLKAKDISLGFEFRKSKVSPFLVVEKKEKRLRKGTTGKQVQFFRKTKGKSGGF